MRADAIGFAVIAAFTALLVWLVPDSYLPLKAWPFLFVAMLLCAWLWWLHPKAPTSPRGWCKAMLQVVACGLFLAGINFFASGAQAKARFAALYVTVFALIVAVAGLARSLARGERNARDVT